MYLRRREEREGMRLHEPPPRCRSRRHRPRHETPRTMPNAPRTASAARLREHALRAVHRHGRTQKLRSFNVSAPFLRHRTQRGSILKKCAYINTQNKKRESARCQTRKIKTDGRRGHHGIQRQLFAAESKSFDVLAGYRTQKASELIV